MKKIFGCKTCSRGTIIEVPSVTKNANGDSVSNYTPHATCRESSLQCVCGNYGTKAVATV